MNRRVFRGNIGAVILVLGVCLMTGCSTRVQTQPSQQQAAGAPSVKPDVIEAKPEWFGCQSDQDCRVVGGLCGAQQAVNRSFLQPFFEYVNRMNSVIECAVNAASQAPQTAQCIQRRCSLVPKQK